MNADYRLLRGIHSPADLKGLGKSELKFLAEEIRCALIEKASICGGHLASNMGIVEITIAMHYVFNSPIDKFVFDVSHQTYCHKMLTGRARSFLEKEHYYDVTGFSNPKESPHDFFNMGHTSTSISLATGLAKARDLVGGSNNIIAVIGDGALGGGQAFEGLNYATELGTGIIIIVNDNNMSIAENHGGLYKQLKELRDNKGYSSNNYFKSLGLEYHFVEDGNDLDSMIGVLQEVKGTTRPVLIHAVTKKGKGYAPAEEQKEKWHWCRPFNLLTGVFNTSGGVPKENYGAIICSYLLDKMKNDPRISVITAATPICIGFNEQNRVAAGKQFIDVGIMEQHAVSMTTAIAKAGGKPVFATNATFIQRAYDQIEQELCITQCPATLIVTHASVSAHNNVTHSGLLDIPLLANIPNLVYLAPTNKQEYINMLDWSIEQNHHPVAIRVPWNGVFYADREVEKDYSVLNRYEVVKEGSIVAIVALGGFFQLGESVVRMLKDQNGIDATLINPRYITGVDEGLLEELKENHHLVVTIEDGILEGGFGSKVSRYYSDSRMRVLNFGFASEFPVLFNVRQMMEDNGLMPEMICSTIMMEL